MRYSAKRAILRLRDPAELAWEAIAPIWDDLPTSPSRVLTKFMADLTLGQRALIAIDWCQKEVRNGGFRQLFESSTGNLVPWAIDGFRVIGAPKYAQIVRRATSIFGSTYPSSAGSREKLCRRLSPTQERKLEELDDSFLSLLDSKADDLERIRGTYVRRHPDEFVRAAG